MRKSKVINLALMTSVSAWSLAACSAEQQQQAPAPAPPAAPAYKTVAECVDAGNEKGVCETALATMPKFSAKAQCEAQYGVGNCETRSGSDGSSWFMPAMMGFMVGNALGQASAPRYFNDYDYDYDRYRSRDRDRNRYYGGGYVGSGGAAYNNSSRYYRPPASDANRSYQSQKSSYSKSAYSGYSGKSGSYTSSTSRGGFGAKASSMGGCCS